jgi:hypothetical protein
LPFVAKSRLIVSGTMYPYNVILMLVLATRCSSMLYSAVVSNLSLYVLN